MRIIDELMKFITDKTGYTVNFIDSFYSDDSNLLMLRQDPSTATETRYFDGSRVGRFSYSLYSRNLNPVVAVSMLFDIENALDIPNGLMLDSGIEIVKNEIMQSAHFIEKTEKNEKIYTSSFVLDYYMEA